MRRGEAARRVYVGFVQIQEDYTREEFAELRDFLGSIPFNWDKINHILSLGPEGKIQARPRDFVVIRDVPVLVTENFEVVKEPNFDVDFDEIKEKRIIADKDKPETGFEREVRQAEERKVAEAERLKVEKANREAEEKRLKKEEDEVKLKAAGEVKHPVPPPPPPPPAPPVVPPFVKK